MYPFVQIAKLLEVFGVSKREILYRYAKSQLGKEKKGIPDTADRSVNCVEALNQIGIECFGKPFCQGASTITLDTTLKSNSRFQKILLQDVKVGDIIVSPTSGKSIGHVGIVNDSFTIMSNSSLTGLWSNHWDFTGWYKRYEKELGLPVNFYRILI